MDKKSKILFIVLGLFLAASVGATYLRVMVFKDFIIEAETDCDPSLEICFVWECDPEWEECTGDPEEDIAYFKIIRRNAKNIPLCDPRDEDCRALVCEPGEQECEFVYCDAETGAYYEVECSDPETYSEMLLENTEEEADLYCENGDLCAPDALDEAEPLAEEQMADQEATELLEDSMLDETSNTDEPADILGTEELIEEELPVDPALETAVSEEPTMEAETDAGSEAVPY
jgi:hypothetical protein